MKHSPTFLPTASVPWLRRIIAFFVAEVGDQPLALVEVDRDPLIIVEGEVAADQHRRLGQRQQPVAMRRHRLSGRRVEVHHRMRIVARHVDRRMDGEARRIGDERRRLDRIAADVDLDQRRGGHFLEHQIVRVEQEMMLGSRNPRRQMGEDEVVPAVMRDHPVGGGEVDPDRPFLVADLALAATESRPIRAASGRPSRG